MSVKQSSIPENQQPLFEGLQFDSRERNLATPFVPWTEYGDAKKVAMVTSPERGASVDIETRDLALLQTLGHLAHASKMIGLQKIAELNPDSPPRRRIQAHYGSETSDVLNSAPTVQREREHDARSAFAEAYGYKALVDQGHKPIDVSEAFVDEFDEFQDLHYGSKGNKNREQLKKQIQKNQRITENMPHIRRAIRSSMHQDPAA